MEVQNFTPCLGPVEFGFRLLGLLVKLITWNLNFGLEEKSIEPKVRHVDASNGFWRFLDALRLDLGIDD